MSPKKKIIVGAGMALVAIAVIAIGVSYHLAERNRHARNSPLVAAKQQQLANLKQLDAQMLAPGEAAWNPATRTATLRDSGRAGVGLFIRHTFFHIVGDIGFDVATLSALLEPTTSGAPVVLDDPTSFIFKPLHGDVVMPDSALTALFNDYLIDYPDTQLRDLTITSSDDGTLRVTGQTQKIPGLWLDFEMAGPVRLVDHHLFVYEPTRIEIAKIPAKGLLKVVRLQLSNLVQIDTEGAELSGDAIVLDLNHSLPPPTQAVHVADMRLDAAGLHLSFTSEHRPAWPEPVIDRDSYVLLEGGDLKTFRALITHVRMQLVAAGGGKLDTSLYDYRQQIVGGHFQATRAGELIAFMDPLPPTASAPSESPAHD